MEGRFTKLNPFSWSPRTLRVVTTFVFLVLFPLYLLIGLQPAPIADAANYPTLAIPSLRLTTPVAPLELVDHQLTAPATIAGSYSQAEHKTLIIGHSSTVFKKLSELILTDTLSYADHDYRVTDIVTLEKSTIDMSAILASANTDTIILMTCAGEPLPHQDATHRLIITAELVE